MTKANILVVEDEFIVARDIQQTLQRAGYEVVGVAASGAQALAKAKTATLDLVLMDIMINGDQDGIETARQLRQQQNVPVVYLTANGDQSIIERAKTTEPIGFILKPYEEQELLRTVDIALNQYQAQERRSRAALLEYQEQLQALMAETSLNEERQRQRIASAIHDRVVQTLAVCQMRLEGLANEARTLPIAGELEAIGQTLEQTIRDTSSLVFELSPPVLHELGLGAALDWYGEQITSQHSLKVAIIHAAVPLALNSDQRTVLFRSACELMNNAAKHAKANRVVVKQEVVNQLLCVSVEDNGIGIAPEDTLPRKSPRGGVGLFHIRERLRPWGGTLDIRPRPEGGTCARLMFPLNPH